MRRRGSIYERGGQWFARVRYTDREGVRRELKRTCASRKAAEKALRVMRARARGLTTLTPSRKTFAQLADHYQTREAVPPVYRSGRKVAGLRSWQSVRAYVKTLRRMVGSRRLDAITYGQLRDLRTALLDEGRSLANAHRILATMRRMLTVAVHHGWIARNPFQDGDPLIQLSQEVPRERVIDREEERRLLGAASPDLQIKLLIALDTGLRENEIRGLLWSDVDFTGRTITVRFVNAKTERTRVVPMPFRLYTALRLAPKRGVSVLDHPDMRTAWRGAVRRAGLTGLRFHDLRHTYATRLANAGLGIAEIAKLLGHATPTMSFRYVSADAHLLERARAALES